VVTDAIGPVVSVLLQLRLLSVSLRCHGLDGEAFRLPPSSLPPSFLFQSSSIFRPQTRRLHCINHNVQLPNWVYRLKLIQMQYYLGMTFEDTRINHHLAKVNSGSYTKHCWGLQYPLMEADDEPAAVTNMSEIPWYLLCVQLTALFPADFVSCMSLSLAPSRVRTAERGALTVNASG
jgi:hypothetical protein